MNCHLSPLNFQLLDENTICPRLITYSMGGSTISYTKCSHFGEFKIKQSATFPISRDPCVVLLFNEPVSIKNTNLLVRHDHFSFLLSKVIQERKTCCIYCRSDKWLIETESKKYASHVHCERHWETMYVGIEVWTERNGNIWIRHEMWNESFWTAHKVFVCVCVFFSLKCTVLNELFCGRWFEF